MPTPLDQNIADKNRLTRLLQGAQPPAPRPPLPDRALIGERLHDHGDDGGREFRTKLADSLHQLVRQVETLRKNPTKNAAQIELAVADDVDARVNRLLAECEEYGHVIDTFQRTVDAGIDAALTPPPALAPLLPEFRAALLGMTGDQRDAFIERLQGTRYADLLRFAVVTVPHELSGVSFGDHKKLFDATLQNKDPELLTRPGDLSKRRAALADAVDGVRRTAAELVDMNQAAALRALVSEGNP